MYWNGNKHARVTNISLTAFLFLKQTAQNTAQKYMKRKQSESIIQNLMLNCMLEFFFFVKCVFVHLLIIFSCDFKCIVATVDKIIV